jgi:PEP-CTERM motif
MKRWIGTLVTLVSMTSAHQVDASVITFDAVITPGPNATVQADAFFAEYITPGQNVPNAPPPEAFTTQGFVIGGFTIPLTPGRTAPRPGILLDASQCPAEVGTTCAQNGSKYMVTAGEYLSLGTQVLGGSFSLTSFDASSVFGPGGCPLCDPGETIFGAQFIRVAGIANIGGQQVIVANEIFPISQPFQTFVLSDPDWSNVFKVIFLSSDATGNLVGAAVAIDNINATAVPEPASLALLASGLAAAVVRRRGARKA